MTKQGTGLRPVDALSHWRVLDDGREIGRMDRPYEATYRFTPAGATEPTHDFFARNIQSAMRQLREARAPKQEG